MPAVAVYGSPVPKGSHRCVGRNGAHRLIDDQGAALKQWHAKLAAAAAMLAGKYGQLPAPLTVSATFTMARPRTVTRPWPITRVGDVDKLLRAALDGLTAGGLIADDALIVHAEAWRCYPDSPGAPDALTRPGAVLRIETLPMPQPTRPTLTDAGDDPTTGGPERQQ